MATTPQTIFKAITSADLPFVEDWCAEHGGDINVPDHLGRAPVHLAVMSSTPSIIQILIKRGARLNSKLSRGENVLHLAAMRGDMETLLTVMKGLEAENDRERMSDASDSRREVLHIDTLMSDPQVSALHLATIYGRTEIIKVLVSRFGADVRCTAYGDITTLALAFEHEPELAKEVVKTLMELGASSTQMLGGRKISTMQYAASFETDFLGLLSEYDPVGFQLAVDGVVSTFNSFATPLTTVIRELNLPAAMRLVNLGAKAKVDFDAAQEAGEKMGYVNEKLTKEAFDAQFEQAIVLAAEFDMPGLMKILLEKEADPSTNVTEEQRRKSLYFSDCTNALDIVEKKLVGLRGWDISTDSTTSNLYHKQEMMREEKKTAIDTLISEYESVRKELLRAGVRISDSVDLTPTLTPPIRTKTVTNQAPKPPEALDEMNSLLMDAVKDNDIATVKKFTLALWGPDSKQPIRVAPREGLENSAFAMAARHKHFELAKIIVYIAVAQYHGGIVEQSKLLARVAEEIDVYSKLADDTFTIDTIKATSELVKSNVTPQQMVRKASLAALASRTRDADFANFDIEIRSWFPLQNSDIDIHESRFSYFLSSGWTTALEELIRTTGAPFKHVVRDGEINVRRALPRAQSSSPLLQAAKSGKIDAVRLFESETPIEVYGRFALTHGFDTKKVSLEKAREEFMKTVKDWLRQRVDLILHCAVLSRNTELLNYLVSKYPDRLNDRSMDGWTPLLVACSIINIDAIGVLISAGADQTATDNLGRNMIHLLLVAPGPYSLPNGSDVRRVLELVDSSLLQRMLVQRCAEHPGALTPLARWLYKANDIGFARPSPEAMNVLLEYSKGDELEMLDAAGMLPLHVATKSCLDSLCPSLIACRSQTLFREGARGFTPLDLVSSRYLRKAVLDNPGRRRPTALTTPLLLQPLFMFDPEYEEQLPLRDVYATWDICRRACEISPSPRQLLTWEESEGLKRMEVKKDGKKARKQSNGGDEVSLAIYRPGDLY